MLEEFTGQPRLVRRNIVMHKYAFHIETPRLGLVQGKKNLVHS